MYTHVIFDLDGTLLNTLEDLADGGNWVCRQKGWPEHPTQAYKYFVGNGIPKLVERFSPPEHRGREELAETLALFSARYDAHKEDKTAPYPGISHLLKQLKQAGVSVAVLTNKAHPMAREVIDRYFPGLIPTVQGALPDRPVKPDPTLLHELMEALGADPAHTLFVGDSNVDIRTAKNGGLTGCGVLWGFRTREELLEEGADIIVEDPEQLLKLILGP